jgi:hypothetical protein
MTIVDSNDWRLLTKQLMPLLLEGIEGHPQEGWIREQWEAILARKKADEEATQEADEITQVLGFLERMKDEEDG